jgi:hypothetical protein
VSTLERRICRALVSGETVLHAFAHPIRVEPLDDTFTMVIGPDPARNL